MSFPSNTPFLDLPSPKHAHQQTPAPRRKAMHWKGPGREKPDVQHIYAIASPKVRMFCVPLGQIALQYM